MEISQTSNHIIVMPPNSSKKATESLSNVLYNKLIQNRNKIAQIDVETDEQRTFGDILDRSVRTALHMKDMGLKKDDIVTLCTTYHMDTVIPFTAAQFLGAKTANIDPSFSPSEMIHLLSIAQPKIIFATPESEETLISINEKMSLNAKIIIFGKSTSLQEFSSFMIPHKDEENFKPITIHDLKETALIYFSSGSTGLPKAICLNHYSWVTQLLLSSRSGSADPDFLSELQARMSSPVINLCYTRMYWISAGIHFLRSVINGNCCLVVEKFDAKQIWTLLKKYKVSALILTPVQVIEMFANKPEKQIAEDWDHLISIMIIGSSLTKKYTLMLRKEFPKTFVYSSYGQTELIGSITTFNYFNKYHRNLMHKPEKIDSVGLPITGMTYKVVNLETNENSGPYQEGELRLKTEFVMNGYYNTDSSEAFDEEGWLKTGDIVYYDEDFCFYVVDRVKDAFKYQGWFIAPAAIEDILLSHPAVKFATVIGIPKEDGHHPMALVILKDNYSVSEREIEKFVEERVSNRQKLRAGVKFIKDIPLTVTGKVNRRVAKQLVLSGKL